MKTRRFWTPIRIAIAMLIVVTAFAWVWTRRKEWLIGFPAGPAQWRQLEEGFEYRHVQHAGLTFHAVRVDLRRFELRVADARTRNRHMEFVEKLLMEQRGVAAVNGTFFFADTDESPEGWIVDRGTELNAYSAKHWFGSLLVVDGVDGPRAALLKSGDQRPPLSSIRIALQAGPINVRDGVAVPLKSNEAERTAACIVTPTSIVLLATEKTYVNMDYLAQLMARPEADGGFSCRDGLMLDGGPSTQMAIRSASLRVDVRGGWPVPNAVVAVPRSQPQ